MIPLQPIPQCIDCLTALARDVARLANHSDPAILEAAERISHEIIQSAEGSQTSSPSIANRILRKIRQVTGVDDPYAEFKSQEMIQSRKIFARLNNEIPADLRTRAALAAIGNSFDFFKSPAQASSDIPLQLRNGITFHRDNLDRLESFLANGLQRILYLTDNAGEIFFDLPLYEHLKQYCQQLYLVVKGGPALNDLTRADLVKADLADRFEYLADTGTDGAGIDWETVSGEFVDLLESADLIISKGMANFETLYPQTITAPSFFLFKVKCEPIHNYIQAPVNSFMALWKDGN